MNIIKALQNPVFKIIQQASSELNVDSYVIGGFVRDYLLGREFKKDIDIVAIGSGIELALKVSELLPKKPKVQVFKTYGTAMLRFEDTEIEFVGARKESYHFESRNPVVENGTLEDDQNRRDFSINALALNLHKDHFGNLTPYNKNSPFYKVSERKGKILYIGVTFDNAGTNLHTLEDAVEDFHEPVYFEETFDVQIKSADGTLRNMKTKVHNPVQSAKRKCDGLIPLFEQRKVLFKASFGNAETLVVDAERMLQVMIEEYKINGVTMYNPKGKN